MSLFEAKAVVPLALAEQISESLAEHGDLEWSVVEDLPTQNAWLAGIFSSKAEALVRGAAVRELLDGFPLESFEVREIGESEWRDSYKTHFHAWQFGRLHWVPNWERETFRLPDGHAVLWLDPGLAFGTGNHETTRLCVERLVEIAEKRGVGGQVVDAGCGSGILALSAAKLGYRGVIGFDNDPEAVRVSAENAGLNDLSDDVRFFCGDLVSGLAGVQAKVLLANILADVLMRFAPELVNAVAPGGVLVLSGILAVEGAKVREKFSTLALDWALDSRALGEWCDVVLTRPKIA